MRRIFFDWNRPFLAQVADDFIRDRTVEKKLDLSNVIAALPTRRTMRRFGDLLFEKISALAASGSLDSDWTPPELTTLGKLPERLYAPKKRFADPLTESLAWRRAFEECRNENPSATEALIPFPPEPDDVAGGAQWSATLSALHRELAAEGLDFARVAQESTLIPEERRRWKILEVIQKKYWNLLDRFNLWDTQAARMYAVEHHECRTEKLIYLAGASDMNTIQCRMLEQVGERVTIYVNAPPNESENFDAFGRVIPDRAKKLRPTVLTENIFQTRTPVGEAVLAAALFTRSEASAQSTALGVPDEEVIPFLVQELRARGVRANVPVAPKAGANRVVELLDLMARYFETESYDAFAALLRHVDVERALIAADEPIGLGDPLSALDREHKKYVPERIELKPEADDDLSEDVLDSNEIEKPEKIDANSLRRVRGVLSRVFAPFMAGANTAGANTVGANTAGANAVGANDKTSGRAESVGSILRSDALFRPLAKKILPPAEWVAPFDELLKFFYPEISDSAEPIRQEDRQINEGLDLFYRFLNEICRLPRALLEPISAETLVDLFLSHISAVQLHAASFADGADCVGWLDLALDDHPNLIVTGFCEGIVPSSRSSDLFLPDSLRRQLGLEDNRRREARDAAHLAAIVGSRPDTKFIFSRHSLADDPVAPSRLLFSNDPTETARRVTRFFDDRSGAFAEKSEDENGLFDAIKGAETAFVAERFDPPTLHMSAPPPNRMSVTSFADFLQSPYGWFLRRACDLSPLSDADMELGADSFGNIIHDVLQAFGSSDKVRESTDADELSAFLEKKLNAVFKRYAVRHSAGTVVLQFEQIRRRLRRFAQWQAAWRATGTRILATEVSPSRPFGMTVDGNVMTVTGRIDRIDFNSALNRYFVFDYKTFDNVKTGSVKADGTRSNGADGERNNGSSGTLGAGEIEQLLNRSLANSAEKKHRRVDRETPPPAPSPNDSKPADGYYHWINLQLPIYRLIAQQCVAELFSKSAAGARWDAAYIVLPKSDQVKAVAGPWGENDWQSAERTAQWVIRTIRHLWSEPILPDTQIDPLRPDLGPVLTDEARRSPLFADLFPLLGDVKNR